MFYLPLQSCRMSQSACWSLRLMGFFSVKTRARFLSMPVFCPENDVCLFICCIYSSTLQTRSYIMEANTRNPDQTVPRERPDLGPLVRHTGYLSTQTDKTDRQTDRQTNLLFS